jgi:hypothetical protein
MRRLGRENEHSAGLMRAVDDLVAAGGSFGEHRDVTGLELALPVGSAQGRPSGDGDEPFLAADFVVVRPSLLTWRELVEAAAEETGSEALTERADPVAVAGAVILTIPDVLSEQVEDVDVSIVRFGFGHESAARPFSSSTESGTVSRDRT